MTIATPETSPYVLKTLGLQNVFGVIDAAYLIATTDESDAKEAEKVNRIVVDAYGNRVTFDAFFEVVVDWEHNLDRFTVGSPSVQYRTDHVDDTRTLPGEKEEALFIARESLPDRQTRVPRPGTSEPSGSKAGLIPVARRAACKPGT